MLARLHLAVAFLTRLPLPPPAEWPPGSLALAVPTFPLVGLLVGGIGTAAYACAHMLLPPSLAAVLALAATIATTGGLHEDGLADVADGFGGGADKERKLAIMKDSRIGSFGVVAVAVGLMLRAGTLAQLASPGQVAGALLAAHALARAAMPALMRILPPARDTGLGAAAGRPTLAAAGLAAGIGVGAALLLLPSAAAVAAILGAAIGAAAVALLAWRQIGGQTGDVLGAAEQVAETLAMLAVVAAA